MSSTRFAWAKLNAYGFIVAGLCVLGGRNLINPGGADLARLVGDVPPGQHVWVVGYIIAGLLLLYSFVRADRLAETAGIALLFASLLLQSAVAFALLGWVDFTYTRLALIVIIGGGGLARISALWSRDGLTITIPPRSSE